jgi:hypothetical protein
VVFIESDYMIIHTNGTFRGAPFSRVLCEKWGFGSWA